MARLKQVDKPKADQIHRHGAGLIDPGKKCTRFHTCMKTADEGIKEIVAYNNRAFQIL